jgi:hypothetical protein
VTDFFARFPFHPNLVPIVTSITANINLLCFTLIQKYETGSTLPPHPMSPPHVPTQRIVLRLKRSTFVSACTRSSQAIVHLGREEEVLDPYERSHLCWRYRATQRLTVEESETVSLGVTLWSDLVLTEVIDLPRPALIPHAPAFLVRRDCQTRTSLSLKKENRQSTVQGSEGSN